MNGSRYPLNRILADYLLGGSGMLMSGALVALAPTSIFVLVIFGGLTAVFLLFTIRTAFRHRLRIAVDAEGLTVMGGPVRRLDWQDLKGLSLRYYSTRRNRKDGWMTLGLKAGGRSLSIDSHLEGFESLARLASDAALARGLDLDAATRGNLAALDIPLPEPAAPMTPDSERGARQSPAR
jgi:hypothetical protein